MNPITILRDAWHFFRSHLLALALLCMPLLALKSLTHLAMVQWLGDDSSAAYDILVGLMFSPLYGAALILYVASRSAGASPGLLDLLARALQLWPVYALLTALSAILIMCGLALFILPGVWIMLRISFAEYLLVLRGMPPLEALRESFRLTAGHAWQILACMACVVLPVWTVTAWIFHPEGGLDPTSPGTLPLQVLIGFAQLFMTVVLFRFFMLVEVRDQSPSAS
jgi:hypothetical protein